MQESEEGLDRHNPSAAERRVSMADHHCTTRHEQLSYILAMQQLWEILTRSLPFRQGLQATLITWRFRFATGSEGKMSRSVLVAGSSGRRGGIAMQSLVGGTEGVPGATHSDDDRYDRI